MGGEEVPYANCIDAAGAASALDARAKEEEAHNDIDAHGVDSKDAGFW